MRLENGRNVQRTHTYMGSFRNGTCVRLSLVHIQSVFVSSSVHIYSPRFYIWFYTHSDVCNISRHKLPLDLRNATRTECENSIFTYYIYYSTEHTRTSHRAANARETERELNNETGSLPCWTRQHKDVPQIPVSILNKVNWTLLVREKVSNKSICRLLNELKIVVQRTSDSVCIT